MADRGKKNPDNIAGSFYVDHNCIACDACCIEAPGLFKMNDIQARAYVAKQPTNATEESLCQEALACCPVDAIGNDGD